MLPRFAIKGLGQRAHKLVRRPLAFARAMCSPVRTGLAYLSGGTTAASPPLFLDAAPAATQPELA
jgi:hypothetical protein